jgi:hypothetical protein
MDGSDKFEALHTTLIGISKPVYDEAGTPKQIYYLAKWGVYEVPFSWWYRCCWLTGRTMDVYEIDNDQCPYVSGGPANHPPIMFAPYDTRLTFLSNVANPESIMATNASLSSILQRLPGVLSRSAYNSIAAEYTTKRNYWLEKINSLLQNIVKKCYYRKEYVSEYAALSEEYQLAWIQNYLSGSGFYQTDETVYRDANNQTVCTGRQCTVSVGLGLSTFSSATGFANTLIGYFSNTTVSVSSTVLLGGLASVLNNEYVFIPSIANSNEVNPDKWDLLKGTFPNNPNGCEIKVTTTSKPTPVKRCV